MRFTRRPALPVMFIALTAVAVSHGVLPGQQRPPTYRSGVDAVTLDVSVLDPDRRPVRGLTASDFIILEDDRPQSIQTFTAVDVADLAGAPAAAAWTREVVPDVRTNSPSADQRVIVIVLDDATPMPVGDIPRAKAMARAVVERLGPGDMAAVTFAINLRASQEFTQDRTRLLAAVDRFNGAIDLASFDGFDVSAGTMYRAAIDAVRRSAEFLADLPHRRKSVVWISVGVPLDWSKTAPALISLDDPGNATLASHIQAVVESLKAMLAAANRSNVNVYGLDPGGLRAPQPRYDAITGGASFSGGLGRLNRDFLEAVSNSTGGFALLDTNDPLPGIDQVFRENGSYYLLGYVPDIARAEGKFRRLDVRVDRPGVTVRTRSGYYEPRPPKDGKATGGSVKQPSLLDAMSGVLPTSGLSLRVAAAPFAQPGGAQADVAIALGIRETVPAGLTASSDEVEVLVHAYDNRTELRATDYGGVKLALGAGEQAEIRFEVLSRLMLAPGRYQLRLAARSARLGLSGSVYCDLEVPDVRKPGVWLSGTVLSVSPAAHASRRGTLAAIIPVQPTAEREFDPIDRVTAYQRIYQGGNDSLSQVAVTARIVDGAGATVFESQEPLGPDRFPANRAAEYRLDLPLDRMRRGPHLLTIVATRGTLSSRRDVRVDVR